MKTAAFYRLLVVSMLTLLAVTFLGSFHAAQAATTGTITGVIRRVDGAAVQDATVTLSSVGVTAASGSTKTDANGYYTFTGVTPGAYTVHITAPSLQPVTTTISVTQDFTSVLDISLEPNTKGVTHIIPNQVQRSQSGSTYTVTEQQEQAREPNPTASYQFPGLVVGVPGITFDPSGGYVHMRGSDENAVSFQQDGIPLIDSLDGQFTTNIVTVGLKDANVETGGQSPDVGNALGGAINEVTKSGRDMVTSGKSYGGTIETELGPGRGWNYTGSQDEFGGILDGGKFDYYLTTVVFRNRFPDNYNGLTNLPDSYDGIYKFDVYPDKNNTFSFYYGKGNEEYQEAEPGLPDESIQLNWKTNSLVNKGSGFADEEMQGYQNTYLSFQHKFNQTSYLSYKFDYNPENVDVYLNGDVPNEEGVFEHFDYHKFVHDLDYQNQVSKKFTLSTGYQYIPQHDRRTEEVYTPSTPYQQDTFVQIYGGSGNGYYAPSQDITTDENAVYLNGQLKPMGDKLTLNLGGRYDTEEYHTHLEGNFTKTAADPRLGIVYSPSKTTAFKAAADTTSQFADAGRVEYIAPEIAGFGTYDTVPGDEAAVLASRYAPSKPDAQHQNNYELGWAQAITIPTDGPIGKTFGGAYTFTATTFQDKEYNLLDYSRPNIVGSVAAGWHLSGPRSYISNGTGHSTGVEAELAKPAKGRYDQSYNGFLSYTNDTVRRTSSFFDGTYVPYFANAFYEVPGLTQQQFAAGLTSESAPSWDQKHTVYAELNKRVTKLVNLHLNLDAGSGYPFVIGVSNLGALGAGLAPSVDSQHTYSVADNFASVPVVMPNGSLQPLNSTPGRSGWHYKFGLNADFDVAQNFSLFVETDNIFDRKTTTIYSTVDAYGNLYYSKPTFAHPQGQVYYGPNTILLPEYVSFGVRLKF